MNRLAPRMVNKVDLLPSHLGGKSKEDGQSIYSKRFQEQLAIRSNLSPEWFGIADVGDRGFYLAESTVRHNGSMSENISKIICERFYSLTPVQLTRLIALMVSTSSPDKLQVRGTHEWRAMNLIESNLDKITSLPPECICNVIELFCCQKTHQQRIVPLLLDVLIEHIETEEAKSKDAIRAFCNFVWVVSKSDVNILSVFNIIACHLSLHIKLVPRILISRTISAFVDCGVPEALETFLNSVHSIIHMMRPEEIMRLSSALARSRHDNIPMIKTKGQQEWLKLPGFKN
eukprot:TRINITY_DN20876_c0_g1_i1.p1 TRINITY_DN20876_c0_g1~~TRINITY_DN20876_c0_g1_i1.p1  ORF type:complete len:310 (+),score=34.95 TRINITY_DN20876_c0_g1_i1:69-932(+)